MQNHSRKAPDKILHKTIFNAFSELSNDWFRRKADLMF